MQFETVETNLGKAMALAGNWHHAYLCSSAQELRQLNRAIFTKLYVDWEGDVRHDLA